MQKFCMCAWRNLIHQFDHNLLRFTNVTQTVKLVNPICCLLMNQSRPILQLLPLCELNLANLYLSISWRLDYLSSIAFTMHLQRRLVLAIFGSTSLSHSSFFFMQHSLQLTLVRVGFYFSDHKLLWIAPLMLLRILFEPPPQYRNEELQCGE